MNKDTILIVDDEPSVLSSLYRSLRSEPWEVLTELSGEQALVRLGERPIKVVISDERMAKMQGTEFLSVARALYPQTVRIMLTGHASLESAISVINNGGIFRFLTKPWNDDDIKQVVREALLKYDREQAVLDAIKSLEDRPDLLPHIEKKYPGISKFILDKQCAELLSSLSDGDLAELLHLLEPGDKAC